MNIVCALIQLIFISAVCGSQCSTKLVRKEIRDLSPQEVQNFIQALRTMHRKSSIDTPSQYDRMVGIHLDHAMEAHGQPLFFPWHRKYLLEFEAALQEIDPSVTLPYWDWTIDSQSPENSIIFKKEYFGGNGSGVSKCITNGPFSDWNMYYPSKHCLSRSFDGGNVMGSFIAPEILRMMIGSAQNYDSFRAAIEGTPHGSVHINIGGDMATMHSPNDPIFWLHHAFVDKIWDQYQRKAPGFLRRYDSLDIKNLSTQNTIAPWKVTVDSIMDIEDLCYSYQEPRFARQNSKSSTTAASATRKSTVTTTELNDEKTSTRTNQKTTTAETTKKTTVNEANQTTTASETGQKTTTTETSQRTTSTETSEKTSSIPTTETKTTSITTSSISMTTSSAVKTITTIETNTATFTTKTKESTETASPKPAGEAIGKYYGYCLEYIAEAAVNKMINLSNAKITEEKAVEKYFGLNENMINQTQEFNLESHNRENGTKIRSPQPLDEHWIAHHMLNKDAIRNTERIIDHAYGILNQESNFLSSSAPKVIEEKYSKFYRSKIRKLRLYVDSVIKYKAEESI